MHIVLWSFAVRDGAEPAFERLYGPRGEWVALFRSSPAYVETELLRAADGSRSYVTIDRWRSREDYDAFRQSHAPAYAALDREGEALTEAERLLGEYTVAPPRASDRAAGG